MKCIDHDMPVYMEKGCCLMLTSPSFQAFLVFSFSCTVYRATPLGIFYLVCRRAHTTTYVCSLLFARMTLPALSFRWWYGIHIDLCCVLYMTIRGRKFIPNASIIRSPSAVTVQYAQPLVNIRLMNNSILASVEMWSILSISALSLSCWLQSV